MGASRWSAQSDIRHCRRSRAAASPKPCAGPLLQHRFFPLSAVFGAPLRKRRRRALSPAAARPVAPRRFAEPSKYQRLIEEDGSWRLRDLLAAQCRPERTAMGSPPARSRLERTLREDSSAMCYPSPPGTSAAEKIEPPHAGRKSA
jgi:hypothetical protein